MSAISENTAPLSPNVSRAAGVPKTQNAVENNATQVVQTQISTPATPATLRLTAANPDQATIVPPVSANKGRGSVLNRASIFNQPQGEPMQGRPRSNTQVSLPRLENVPSSSNSDQTTAATPRSRGSVLSRASVFNQPKEEPVQGRPRSNTQVSLPKLEIPSSNSSSSSSSSPANATPRGSVLNRIEGLNINPLALAGGPRKAPPPAKPAVEPNSQLNAESAAAPADSPKPEITYLDNPGNPTRNRARPQGRRLPTRAASNGSSPAVNAPAINSPAVQVRTNPSQTVVQAEETVVQVPVAEETVIQIEETVVQVPVVEEIAVQIPVVNEIAVQAQIIPENIVETSAVQAQIVSLAIDDHPEPAQIGSLNLLFIKEFLEGENLENLSEVASDIYLFSMFDQMAAMEANKKAEVINMDAIWQGLEDGTYYMNNEEGQLQTALTFEENLPHSIRSFLGGRLVENLNENEREVLINLLAAHPSFLPERNQNPIINMDEIWQGLEEGNYSL
jgi:hypothetical protein